MDQSMDWSTYLDQARSGWILMLQCLDQLRHWLLNDGSSFTIFFAVIGVCAGVVAFAARGNERQLSQSRAGYDAECFVRDMTASGHDENVARTVYSYIEDMHRIDFPILPADDLYTVLGVTDESIRRAMPMLLQATGREPRVGRLLKPLTTVEDLVKFVASAPLTAEYVWEMQTA